MNEDKELLDMLLFKLVESLKYLQPLFVQKADYINDLWIDEGEGVPKFVEKFVMFWNVNDYNVFCRQVKVWSGDHDAVPSEELWCRIRALIMRDKQAYLLGITKGFTDKTNKYLIDKQENIQQLCNEIAEEDDVITVNNKCFEQFNDSFDHLKELSAAMNQHAYYLLNTPLAFVEVFKVNASEQATAILEKKEG